MLLIIGQVNDPLTCLKAMTKTKKKKSPENSSYLLVKVKMSFKY